MSLAEQQAPPRPREREALWLATGASVVAFFVYASRLCPTLSLTGDSAELVTAAALWGVPHAPGYPLFTALAHVFTWLPLSDLPWRVHLTSAVFHGGAVGATVLATFTVTKNRAAALASGCALALERSFFLGSLYAEVFPLNDLFQALLLALALRLRACGAGDKRGVVFAASAGLAATHHMMIALAAPSLAVLALPALAAARPRAHSWLRLGAALLAPFVVYALVPLAASRDPALSWGDVHDARSFLALVTRSDYGGLLSPVHGAAHEAGWTAGWERVAALGSLLVAGFGIPALVVAAVGTADLLRARAQRAVGVSLLLGAFASGPLFAWLNALGTGTEEALAFFERFTTMCALPIAIAFGAGVAAVGAALPAAPRGRIPRTLAFAALTVWATVSFVRVRNLDLRADGRGIAFAHDLVLRTPDRALILLSGDAPVTAALYVCAVERACGDRVVLSPGSLFMPWAMAEARRAHPDVDIPWTGGPALKRTHDLALAESRDRAVFVYPDLLERDPLLTASFTPVPDHLLFRLWPRDSGPDAGRGSFLASAHALACANRCATCAPCPPCDGCLLPYPLVHPTQEVQLAGAYEAAALNHARFAEQVPEARALIPALLARAGDFASAHSR